MRLFLWILIALGPLWAQQAPKMDPVKDVQVTFQKGAVAITVPQGAHLKQGFLSVKVVEGKGTVALGPLPAATGKDELDEPVWHGTLRLPLTGKDLSGDVTLEVEYQPCTEGEGGVCFPPTTQRIQVKASDFGGPSSGGNLLWLLLAAFGWGLAASLTPCVYPMIPITLAIVGAKGSGKLKGLLLALSLVLGMAVTYTSLGVIAGLSGSALGAFAQRPQFLIPVSILFTAFALSLFGAFEIRLPAGLQAKLQGSGPRRGFGGAFVMGLVLGPLAAPCVGPFVGTVLVNIAQHQGVVSGASQLFAFAMGMGMLFVVVGTFSAALPKSGEWLAFFKHVMGLLVLGFAVWNVRLLLPAWGNAALWGVVLLVGAAVFGAFAHSEGLAAQLRRGFGLLLLTLGILVSVRGVEGFLKVDLLPRGGPSSEREEAHPGWVVQDYEGAARQAKAEGKFLLVDVYAAWCTACKELDEKTWPDPAVKAWIAEHAVAVRIDTFAERRDLQKSFSIQGYPTVMLMDPDGKEIRPRVFGFQPPTKMLAWLKGA